MASIAAQPERILIVRPSALGDVARTVPVLVSLKRAFPEAKIDWLVQDSFADVIAHHPDLSEVAEFPRGRFRGFGRNWAVTREVFAYLGQLKQRQYDRVYDLQGLSRSGWLTWFTRAPHRVGPADAREGAWLAYHHRVKINEDVQHTVDRMLAVIEGDGVEPVRDMRLFVGDDDRAWAEAYMKKHAMRRGHFAVVAPTARWLCKCWPVDRYDQIIDRLDQCDLHEAVVVASESERTDAAPLLDHVDGSLRRHDLIGKTTVGQLMAIIDAAGLVLANDSAALHIAVGLGRRVVSVFGPTDPAKVGPYRYSTGLVCAETEPGINYRSVGDDQTLIAGVSVDAVWQAVQRVLQSPPPPTDADGSTA